jgi:hypothetical protein
MVSNASIEQFWMQMYFLGGAQFLGGEEGERDEFAFT